MSNTNNLNVGLGLATKGVRVLFVRPDNKIPYAGSKGIPGGTSKTATTNPDELRVYHKKHPDALPAIVGGSKLATGAFISFLDIDPKDKGKHTVEENRAASKRIAAEIEAKYPGITKFAWRESKSGGRHYWLLTTEPLRTCSKGVVHAEAELRGADTYVVVWPDVETSQSQQGATVPQSLIDLIGAPATKSDASKEKVADAPDLNVENARQWLKTAERGVVGNRDTTAYKVACYLRDLGISKQQAIELMTEAEWDCGDLGNAPINSAYTYAQGEPGSKAALPGDFPIIDELQAIPENIREAARIAIESARNAGWNIRLEGEGIIATGQGKETDAEFMQYIEQIKKLCPAIRVAKINPKFKRMSEIDAKAVCSADYLIKGFINRRSFINMYGQPGEGKTFCSLDMAYHIAAGKAWRGEFKVRQAPVLFLAFEAPGSVEKRMIALRQHYGNCDDLIIAPANFNLKTEQGKKDFRQLLIEVIEVAGSLGLIIIDTWSKLLSYAGFDENSATDIGIINAYLESLGNQQNVAVMVISHSGKNKKAGARGSNALQGAVTTELEIDNHTIITHKQRDGEELQPVGFNLHPLVIGLDSDNEEMTSCVVVPVVIKSEGRQKLRGNPAAGFDVLCDLSPDNSSVTESAWQEACAGDFLEGENVRRRFVNLKKNLKKYGYIEIDEQGLIKRRME